MSKLIIFDLDGTLIDSLEDIAISMNKVLEEFTLKTYEVNRYRYFVGGGVDILAENILKDQSKLELKEQIKKRFKEIYDNDMHSKTKVYDGIYELLDELEKRGFDLAILSNKPDIFTKEYAKTFFEKYNFKEVHGQKEDIPKKPNPTMAINIAKSFSMPCEEVYFVGDTLVDMQTANRANMKAIGVLWGFRDEKELREHNAHFIVKNPLDILGVVDG